ncbi:MAG: ABC transporter permease [Chloroflexi bacterium]|nr:ABC transporter permease [Chloroflexota bacterium]
MIGTIAEFDSQLLEKMLLFYLPLMVLSLGVGGGTGIGFAQFTIREFKSPQDTRRSWLQTSPLTPVLALGALVLPFMELSFIAATILLALLILPTMFVFAMRYYAARTGDTTRTRIERRKVLSSGWHDIVMVSLAFLGSSLVYLAVVPESQEAMVDHLGDLPVGLVFGVALGVALGIVFGNLKLSVDGTIEKRHERDLHNPSVDTALSIIRGGIEMFFTQLHSSPLIGVLMVMAASLPFLEINHRQILPFIIFPPLTSAIIAALLVDDPAPDQPNHWQHLRMGLANTTQIAASYLVGAAMLEPLTIMYSWMHEEPEQVRKALRTHLDLTMWALGISLFAGIVGGILASRLEAVRSVLINLGNIGRTLPSLAVLALALPLLSSLDDGVASVESSIIGRDIIEISAIGRNPSLVALAFIGILPILVNTSVGILQVSPDIKESARGMGMNDLQVLFRVEIPIAMPVIMAGIRTSAVLLVASAALAGFIGGGGLGDLIYRGDSSGRDDILLTGAIMATILAIFLEYFFGWLENLLTPRGLRDT